MFCEKVIVLRNVFVVEIGDAKIKNDIQYEWKIKKGEVKPEVFSMHRILPTHINKQHMKWLDEKVQEKKKRQVGDKFFLHERKDIKEIEATCFLLISCFLPNNQKFHPAVFLTALFRIIGSDRLERSIPF